MYKIIKETINCVGNVIESKEIGIFEDYDLKSLAKVANVINTNYIINGSDNRCRFKIIDLLFLTQDDLDAYCESQIEHYVKAINGNIKYKNNAAVISAKWRNLDKVPLIKELRLEDYLYPIGLEIKLVKTSTGLLVG